MNKQEQQVVAKTLLVSVLKLPDGVASQQLKALTDAQLHEVCQVTDEPVHARRQVLKAVLGKINDAPVAPPVVEHHTRRHS